MRLYSLALLFVVATEATSCDQDEKNSAVIEQRAQEANQRGLIAADAPPRLTTSLERRNLKRRLERINTENLVSYIYLISQTGKVMAFYTVDGKVTSLNAYLSGNERVVYGPGAQYWQMESPDYDGAYGKNADGVFFFTTEGVYVEWFGEYLWSDQPLKLTQQPELIYQLPSKEHGAK